MQSREKLLVLQNKQWQFYEDRSGHVHHPWPWPVTFRFFWPHCMCTTSLSNNITTRITYKGWYKTILYINVRQVQISAPGSGASRGVCKHCSDTELHYEHYLATSWQHSPLHCIWVIRSWPRPNFVTANLNTKIDLYFSTQSKIMTKFYQHKIEHCKIIFYNIYYSCIKLIA